MGAFEEEEARMVAARKGDNVPIEFKDAFWDGNRSIRLEVPGGHIGLATTAYSYKLTHEERLAVARRLSALWRLAAERKWTTEDIERMTE